MKATRRTVLGSGLAATAAITLGVTGRAAHGQAKEPIKFATLLDFTRIYTFGSVEYSQGQQDYIKLVNVEGGIDGHPIALTVKDHASHPQQGIALYNQALREGNVFFDFLSTPVANAIMPRANEDKVPMLAFAHGRSDAIDGERFPYVFPAAAIYWSQAALLLQYIDQQAGGLKGKKIAFVHIDSPFGREPIELLETVSRDKGFEFKNFPYPVPGTEQAAAWTEVRRYRPDAVVIWGAGPGQAVSIRGAIGNGISPSTIYSVVWLSATDMQSFEGDTAAGVKRVTLVNSGTGPEIVQRIVEKVVKPGNGSGDEKTVASTYYNIGVASLAVPVEAARLALAKLGAPLTGEKLKAGFEMIKDFDAGGLTPPLTITEKDHQGGGQGRITEWNGKDWEPRSDWSSAEQDLVWKLVHDLATKGT
ncbi:MAG: ABC transporter substrate-binding protein [Burkholderiaceae bacterium]